MAFIACPGCGEEIKVFLIESKYEGPLKCANCKGLFRVRIEGEQLKAWESMTEEELRAAQEMEELRAKFRRGGGGD